MRDRLIAARFTGLRWGIAPPFRAGRHTAAASAPSRFFRQTVLQTSWEGCTEPPGRQGTNAVTLRSSRRSRVLDACLIQCRTMRDGPDEAPAGVDHQRVAV